MYGDSNMETYLATCEIDSQWEFAIWLRELNQGLCDSLEGWEGREVQEREDIGVPIADSYWYTTEHQKSL